MDYLFLLFLVLLLIIALIILINIKKNNEKNSYSKDIFQEYDKKQQTQNESLGRQEQALSNLRVTIQEFQEPLQKLRNYLSGGTRAGQFGEWSLQAMMQDIFPEHRYKENEEIIIGSGQRVEFALILPGGLLLSLIHI